MCSERQQRRGHMLVNEWHMTHLRDSAPYTLDLDYGVPTVPLPGILDNTDYRNKANLKQNKNELPVFMKLTF